MLSLCRTVATVGVACLTIGLPPKFAHVVKVRRKVCQPMWLAIWFGWFSHGFRTLRRHIRHYFPRLIVLLDQALRDMRGYASALRLRLYAERQNASRSGPMRRRLPRVSRGLLPSTSPLVS